MAINTTSIDVTTIQCRNCRATWDVSLNFCGRCGQRLRGVAASVQLESTPYTPYTPLVVQKNEHAAGSKRRVLAIALVLLLAGVLFASLFTLLSDANTRPRTMPMQSRAIPAAPARGGVLWFSDVYAQSDGVVMHLSNLPPLTEGHTYAGWLLNAYRPDLLFPLGSLTPDKNGVVSFDSSQFPTFNPSRQNLRVAFTRVVVTLESSPLSLSHPLGPTILQGMIQVRALDALTPLFAPTTYLPGNASLIAGMRSQMRELARWVANMLDSLSHSDSVAIQADLLRLVYVIEGSQGVDSASLHVLAMPNIQNEGDGFGLLTTTPNCQVSQYTCGYFATVRRALQTLLTLHVASTQDVQSALIALTTAEQLTNVILQHVLSLVSAPSFSLTPATRSSLMLVSTQTDTVLNGVDRDGDGRIDPVSGEAAIAQLYTYLQAVGAIKLS